MKDSAPGAYLAPAMYYPIPSSDPAIKEPLLVPGLYIKSGEWENGLCGCCKHCIPNCCTAFCCPCVSLAQISARLGIAPYCWSLILYIVVVTLGAGLPQVFLWIWICQARYITRQRFGIPGSCCCDCCVSILCSNCALAQMATHIKSYTPGSCYFGPKDTLPAYPVHLDP